MSPAEKFPSEGLNPSDSSQPAAFSRGFRPAPPLYEWFDQISGWIICTMAVFTPWAFGTTQPWSIWTMNALGYTLGALLISKWFMRWQWSFAPPREDAPEKGGAPLIRMLAVLTVLVLAYCFVSAVNARSTYSPAIWTFHDRDYISWLPHSLDASRTWPLFWNYTALAFFFWALRDWLLGRGAPELGARRGSTRRQRGLPARMRLLLWVVSVNGALLALQGLIQQVEGSGKLLWLVEPRINKLTETQFGPYAYRSNAAQFLNLIWPVTLGFWWSMRGSTRIKPGVRNLLLPCALLMAVAPIFSNSRGGALIAFGSLLAVGIIFLLAERENTWQVRTGVLSFILGVIVLGWAVGWKTVGKRMENLEEGYEDREKVFEVGRKIAEDYPLFGIGPGALDPVFQLYRESVNDTWLSQMHNDWLETLVTFGWVGSTLIGLALLTVLVRWFLPGGIAARAGFVSFLWVALGGCLLHARFDFPFQIYSILFLFLLLCGILFTLSRKRSGD
jgi:hypothetical protein